MRRLPKPTAERLTTPRSPTSRDPSSNDVSELRLAQEALRESERRLRALIANAPVILFALDHEGIVTLSEGKGLEALGLRPGQHVGRCIFDLYGDLPQGIEQVRRALAGEPLTSTVEVRGLTFETHLAPVRDEEGRVTGVIGVAVDVTERIRAEKALRQSEANYRRIFESMQDIFYRTDVNGIITEVSPSVERYGYTREGLIGRSVQELCWDPEDRAAHLRALAEHGEVVDCQIRLKTADGRLGYASESARLLRGADGTILGAEGFLRDITERVLAEEALRQGEERLHALSEAASEGIAISDQGRIIEANQTLAAMSGYELSELIGSDGVGLIAPEHRDLVRQHILSGYEEPYEVKGVRKDGTTLPIEVRARNMSYQGRAVRVIAIRDLTERKRAEEALRESEERFRRLAENARDVIFRYRLAPTSAMEYVSPAITETTGYTPEELYADPDLGLNIVHPEDRRAAQQITAGEATRHAVLRWIRRDGAIIWMEGRNVPVFDDAGNLIAMEGIFRDVTEQKRAEEALRESEERFRRLSEAAFEGIAITENGRILDVSQSLAAICGYDASELIGKEAAELVAPEYGDLARQNIHSGYEQPYEMAGLRKDGTTIPIEVRGKAIPYRGRTARVTAVRDISERKREEHALQKAREELEEKVERQIQRDNRYGLTFRELTVLHLVAAGKSEREIGVQLGISPLTARKHVEHILAKMGSTSRTEASVRALREGLVQ